MMMFSLPRNRCKTNILLCEYEEVSDVSSSVFCKFACSCTEIIFVLFSSSKILNSSFLEEFKLKPDHHFFSSPSGIAEHDLHLHAICNYCMRNYLKGIA